MKTFKRFIIEIVYKPEKHESELLYHISPHDIESFNHLSHFGTKIAARQRGHEKGYTKLHQYTVRLKLGNVKNIDDTGSNEPYDIVDSLYNNGHISKDEHANLRNTFDEYEPETHAKKLSLFLRKKNIHTLSYINDFEDRGKKSYIITHPSQVRIIHKGHGFISKRNKLENI